MNNIIVFPKGFKDHPPQTLDELILRVSEEKQLMVEEAVDEVMSNLLGQCHAIGIPVENDFDIGFILGAIRSGMLRSVGEFDPMQEMADKMVVIKNEKGQQVYANGAIYDSNSDNS